MNHKILASTIELKISKHFIAYVPSMHNAPMTGHISVQKLVFCRYKCLTKIQ